MKLKIEVSARHLHLDQADFQKLFGKDELTKRNDLSVKGEFAAEEKVEIAGPDGQFHDVRILGPLREATQLEISFTDARKLGIEAPLLLSGSEADKAKVKIIGPKSTMIGVFGMVAKRHAHLTPDLAHKLKIKDNDKFSVNITGDRSVVLKNIIARVGEEGSNTIHIDTDEANAAGIVKFGEGEIVA